MVLVTLALVSSQVAVTLRDAIVESPPLPLHERVEEILISLLRTSAGTVILLSIDDDWSPVLSGWPTPGNVIPSLVIVAPPDAGLKDCVLFVTGLIEPGVGLGFFCPSMPKEPC